MRACISDAGGSNSYRTHLYKAGLQNLANALELDLKVVHYPPYASKWNPIEHRVFCHITSSLSGVILTDIEIVKKLIAETRTNTGLKVFSRISKKIYQKGKKVAENFYETAKIVRDKILGDFNYVVSPM
jgi:hypothetical protein